MALLRIYHAPAFYEHFSFRCPLLQQVLPYSLICSFARYKFYSPFSLSSLVSSWYPKFVGNHAKNPSVHHGWIAGRKKSSRRIVLQPTTKGELWGSRPRKFVSAYRQVGCTGSYNFLWKKAQPYAWREQGTLPRNCLLYLSLKREVSQNVSHRAREFTSRLHGSQEKTFQVKRWSGKRCWISGNDTPTLSSNKLPHPSISLLSGENFLNKDLISRTALQPTVCNKQLY